MRTDTLYMADSPDHRDRDTSDKLPDSPDHRGSSIRGPYGVLTLFQGNLTGHDTPKFIERLTPDWRQVGIDLSFLWVGGTPVLVLCAKLLAPYHDLHNVITFFWFP